jgi:hypothetical protein
MAILALATCMKIGRFPHRTMLTEKCLPVITLYKP